MGAIGGFYGGRLATSNITTSAASTWATIPYLYTRPREEAKKVGFEMPKLAMLEAELRFLAASL